MNTPSALEPSAILDLIRRDHPVVAPTDLICDAWVVLREAPCSCVAVVDRMQRFAGMFGTAECAAGLMPAYDRIMDRPGSFLSIGAGAGVATLGRLNPRVAEVADRRPVWVRRGCTPLYALSICRRYRTDVIPVLEGDRVEGVLCQGDLIDLVCVAGKDRGGDGC